MQTIVNDEKKIAVTAWPRCGTEHLAFIPKRHAEWKKTNRTFNDLHVQGYSFYGAVRHPVERFKSWFSAFIIDTEENLEHDYIKDARNWNLEDCKWFFRHFEVSMHYDTHTAFQKYLYKNLHSPTPINYFDYKNIDWVCNIPNYKFNTGLGWKSYIKNTDPKIVGYIEKKAQTIYDSDIKWYESLKLISKKKMTKSLDLL